MTWGCKGRSPAAARQVSQPRVISAASVRSSSVRVMFVAMMPPPCLVVRQPLTTTLPARRSVSIRDAGVRWGEVQDLLLTAHRAHITRPTHTATQILDVVLRALPLTRLTHGGVDHRLLWLTHLAHPFRSVSVSTYAALVRHNPQQVG